MSLKFPLVLKCFNGVSRPFKVCLRFKGSFKDVSNKSVQGVSRKFLECFKEVSENFQGVLRKFQGCFN